MAIRIGNGAGFWGDQLAAPRRVVETTDLDYLTLEYLAELTMSILARQREKDPARGYASDFLTVLEDLTRSLQKQSKLRIITNAGGMNPLACAQAAAKILAAAGMGEEPIGVVTGDDLLPRLKELQAAGCKFENLDTGQPLSELKAEVVSANAYLGARPIVEALAEQARVVITGRVADASLTLAPAVHEFDWSWTDYDRLAAATVAGHLIECGAQATGGYSTFWKEMRLADVGYPIVELSFNGGCVVTKSEGSGGAVTRETVAEQLIYEIGDPAHYLTPDVDVDFTNIATSAEGTDRIRVEGARGAAPPSTLKVSLAYRAGFTASGQMLVYGEDCVAKARECAKIILQRVCQAGFELDASNVECFGAGDGVPGQPQNADPPEVMLRLTARDARRDAIERFSREFAPLATSGPAGLAGYASGRPEVRPVFAYWPTLVPRELVNAYCYVRTAAKWAALNTLTP